MATLGVIGAKRLEYLDLANKAFSAREYQAADAYLESFLTTVNNDSVMGKEIQGEFDRIEQKRIKTWEKTVEETKNLDSWTQSEVRSNQRISLSLEILHEKIDSCWKVSMKGRFYE